MKNNTSTPKSTKEVFSVNPKPTIQTMKAEMLFIERNGEKTPRTKIDAQVVDHFENKYRYEEEQKLIDLMGYTKKYKWEGKKRVWLSYRNLLCE